MLESKINAMKERLWPAGIAALVLHSLMITAMALGITYPQGMLSPNFCVEVMFASEPGQEKRADESTREPSEIPLKKVTKISQTKKSSMPSGKKVASAKTNFKPSGLASGYPSAESSDALPIFNPPPLYPDEAKRKGIQGVVLVRLSLMETGTVDNAITLPPHIDPLLEDAALRAVRKWRFKPGARTLEVPIEFKLEA